VSRGRGALSPFRVLGLGKRPFAAVIHSAQYFARKYAKVSMAQEWSLSAKPDDLHILEAGLARTG